MSSLWDTDTMKRPMTRSSCIYTLSPNELPASLLEIEVHEVSPQPRFWVSRCVPPDLRLPSWPGECPLKRRWRIDVETPIWASARKSKSGLHAISGCRWSCADPNSVHGWEVHPRLPGVMSEQAQDAHQHFTVLNAIMHKVIMHK